MVEEIWKVVPGFEGAYEVSDQGRVRSLPRFDERVSKLGKPFKRFIQGRMLRPTLMPCGHRNVTIGVGARTYGVHVLVMRAFVGPTPEGQEVRHLNGVAGDNRLSNLAYSTHSRNMMDKKWHSHRPSGYKLSPEQVRYIKANAVNRGDNRILAEMFGVTHSNISAIKRGKSHTDV